MATTVRHIHGVIAAVERTWTTMKVTLDTGETLPLLPDSIYDPDDSVEALLEGRPARVLVAVGVEVWATLIRQDDQDVWLLTPGRHGALHFTPPPVFPQAVASIATNGKQLPLLWVSQDAPHLAEQATEVQAYSISHDETRRDGLTKVLAENGFLATGPWRRHGDWLTVEVVPSWDWQKQAWTSQPGLADSRW